MRPSGSVAMIFDHSALCFEHALPDAHIDWRLDGAAPVRKGPRRLRRCPECCCVHEISPECPNCGFVYPKISRDVETVDGTLVVVRDATYSARKELVPRPKLPAPPGMMTIAEYARHCEAAR
jgi:DNA repair protein RadD